MNGEEKKIEELEFELRDLQSKLTELESFEKIHKRVVQQLKESEERCRLLVNNAQDGIFILQDDAVKFPNPFTLVMTGYSEEELAALPFSGLVHPADRAAVTGRLAKALEEHQSPGTFSFRTVGRAGDDRRVEMSTTLITWEERPAVLCLVRDITAQAKQDADLLYMKKMEAIGTLAGGIAHDFNNHLQAISGYIQLLMMKKDLSGRDHHFLTQMEKSVQRAAILTKQLLIFSRKEEGRLKPSDLNEILQQACKLLLKTLPETISVELNLAKDLGRINADAVQIEHVMFNMGLNAKDAMPDGGKLRIETRNVTLDEKFCESRAGFKPGTYAQLVLSDTGHGMDRETLEHIFEPFYTTKGVGMGTGLGLSIAYGIVQGHQGHITCESEPGRGTTFRMYFPLLESESGDRAAEPGRKAHLYGGETILLVDDETSILDIGESILGQFGYSTVTARSGEEALEIYGARMGEIGLIILDLGMPGMGGEQCLQEILKINPKARVVIASGYAASQTVQQLMAAGATGYIPKPYRLEEMLKKIREILDTA